MVLKHHVKKQRSLAQWRESVAIILKVYFDSITIQLIILGVSLLSCIIYIVETYTHEENLDLEVFFFSVFLFDYIMCITEASNKLDYVVSPMGLADFGSMIPLVGIFLGKNQSKEYFESQLFVSSMSDRGKIEEMRLRRNVMRTLLLCLSSVSFFSSIPFQLSTSASILFFFILPLAFISSTRFVFYL